MDATTITGSSFTLTPSGGSPVAATVSYDSATQKATLTPNSPLASSTTYNAQVDTTVKAADGVALAAVFSWSFTTQGPPTVTAKTPPAGATGVSVSIAPTATFSRAMDASTITASSFTLKTSSGASIAAAVSYDATTLTATLKPNAILASSTTYTATLAATIRAADGAALAPAVSWSFTTLAAPTVSARSPKANATGVSVVTTVTATFSRDMDPSTITSSSFTLTPSGGAPVAATVNYNASTRVATLTPSAQLAYGTTFTATLASSVRASDGAPLASAVTWKFTTQSSTVTPTVTGTTPRNNATGVSTLVAPTASFSTAMDPTTITSSSFTLSPSGGVPVAASVDYNSANATATLRPATPLATRTYYTGTLTTAITSVTGVPLASTYTWTFRTGAAAAAPAKPPKSGAIAILNREMSHLASAWSNASFDDVVLR